MSMRKSRGLQRAAVGLGVAALNAASHANVFYVNFPDVVIGPDQDGEHFENLIGSVIFDFATPAITMRPPGLSCSTSEGGIWLAAAVTTMQSKGAFSGQP